MAQRALIQIMFPDGRTYGPKAEKRYLWPPLLTSCEVRMPTLLEGDFGEGGSDVRLEFRNVIMPQEKMRQVVQLGNVLVVYDDTLYRVQDSREERSRINRPRTDGAMALTAVRKRDYNDSFVALEAGGKLLTVGEAVLGTGATR